MGALRLDQGARRSPATAARELMERVRPFVFRRHLDYNAIDALRDLHRQIRREVERRDIADNIKLGPGGIREIEFIVQVFQLIRGGREPAAADAAHARGAAAARCAQPPARRGGAGARRTPTGSCATSSTACSTSTTSRRTTLPDRGRGPRADRRGHGDARLRPRSPRALERHRANVTRHFEAIFAARARERARARAPVAGERSTPRQPTGVLAGLGFRDPAAIEQRLRGMRSGSRYREMPAASQALLDRLVPLAVEAAAAESDPDVTLERLLGLLESICRRDAYLALLMEYPQALSRLAAMMSASPWVGPVPDRATRSCSTSCSTRARSTPRPHWPSAARELRGLMDDAARRHREADGRPAPLQARADDAPDRAGPRRASCRSRR